MIEFLKKLLALSAPYKVRLGLGILFGILCGLFNPAMMITVKVVFGVLFDSPESASLADELAKAPGWLQPLLSQIASSLPRLAGTENKAVVVLAITLIPVVMFCRGLTGYLNIYFLQWVAIRAVTDLRKKLFNHVLNLSVKFFHGNSTGDLMSRIIYDTAALQGTISNSLAVMIVAPVTLVGLAALLLTQHFKLTLISMLVFPLCILPILIYSRKVRKSSAAIQTNFAELSQVMHESFTGNRIIKAYNLEPQVQDEFATASKHFVSNSMRIVRSTEIPGPLIEFFGALGVAFIFYYLKVITQTPMKTGDFLQYVGSIFLMYQPIKALSRLHQQLEQARAASDRVFELLATESTVVDPPQPVPLRAAKADISFEDIEFNYGDKQVLHSINLKVKAGQVVALVGSSGSGKTTMTNLLLRFYDPQHGAVRIGGTDIRQVSLKDLRAQIAVVTQEVILFNDTVRNNIALGRPGATDTEIEEAARHAHAHDFILQKPNGYDTVIGEKGVTLSGGQRQRLAIARAILKNAPILVLDEATSALDSESERAVQAALEELMHHQTTICIAHRLSTVQNADLIVVMDHGRIVETGKHAELLQRGGIYRKLYELQFQG